MSFQIRKERTSASTQPWLSYNAYVSQQLIATRSKSTAMAESQAVSQPARLTKRVLACIQCQQRKIKCDRNFPCSNCNRFNATCIPANSLPPKARRKRFPERELLDRLHQYEELLRKNNITFNAMHATSPPDNSTSSDSPDKDSDNTVIQSREALDLWKAITRVTLESDDDDDDDSRTPGSEDVDHEAIVRAYTNRFAALNWPSLNSNDHLLFGVPTEADLSNLHPPQAHMFRLWQVYLDNVNPLLKITHTPTLQPRIIDAMSNISAIDSHLEALIFSIYCIAVVTLSHDECIAYFQCSRVNLLIIFHNACQQALLKCGVWQVGSDDGLTALVLYLMSLKSVADMRSITSMLATAVRIGHRLGIHMESTYAKCTPLQAEMRRRLWWTLVTFDHRMCEMCDYRSSSLMPTWDCKTPLNATDYVLRSDMKTPPAAEEKPTEACFAVTRARINDVLRHNTLHLNFLNPVLKQLARSQDDNGIGKLEKDMAEKFATWDMADPLQFMTATTAEALIARCRLLEHYSSHQASLTRPTDQQRSAALLQALKMLECDTTLRNAPSIRHFVWFTDLYFPALAYHHILNGLTRKPNVLEATNAWRIMNEHYEAVTHRPALTTEGEFPGVLRFYSTSGQVFLLAWRIYLSQHSEVEAASITPPRVVHDIMKTSIEEASTEGPAWMTWENKGSDLTQAQFNNPPVVEPPRKSVPPEDVFGQAIMDVDSDAFWENLGLT